MSGGQIMRSHLLSVVAFLGIITAGVAVYGADDPAPVGKTWTGVLKRFGAPNEQKEIISSTDAAIKITERDGDEFTGALGLQNNTRVGEIQGTITSRGAVKFTVTKFLKGPKGEVDSMKDIIGRAKFVGAIKEEKLTGKFTIPKNTGNGKAVIPRFGTLELTQD